MGRLNRIKVSWDPTIGKNAGTNKTRNKSLYALFRVFKNHYHQLKRKLHKHSK